MKLRSSNNYLIILMVISQFTNNQMMAQTDSIPSKKLFAFQDLLFSRGIDVGASFTGDYFSNLSREIHLKDSYINNFTVGTGLDFKQIAGVNGLSFYVSGIGIAGGTILERTGALQGISNIAGVNHWKLYECWAEQELLNESFSLLFGLYDLNSEFDVRESSGLFLNPSFGIGFDFAQSGQNGPSVFPYTSLALRIKFELSESFRIQSAVFDGVPGNIADETGLHIHLSNEEGMLVATEFIFSSSIKESEENYFKYSIGGWYYTSDFKNTATGNYENGNYGIYINGEQFVYYENSSADQGLAIFGRIGVANSNFNPSDLSFLGGLNYTGIIPNRDKDDFGLAFTSVHLDPKYRTSEEINPAFETIIELTYSVQINDWLRFQPDLQYIINPALAPQVKDIFVVGIRTEFSI